MNTLAINTAFTQIGISLTKDDVLVANYYSVCKKRGEQLIFRVIEQLLQNAQMELEAIDCFVVAQGPGSYTALRIGMSIVKTLAQVHQKPLIGVNSLECLASMVRPQPDPFYVLLNCSRSEIFWAQYRFDLEQERGQQLEACSDIHFTTLDKVWDKVKDESVVLKQAVPNAKYASPLFQELSLLPLEYPIADAFPVLQRGLLEYERCAGDYPIVLPLYMKKDV